jgi:hypothetical protein
MTNCAIGQERWGNRAREKWQSDGVSVLAHLRTRRSKEHASKAFHRSELAEIDSAANWQEEIESDLADS